MRILILILIFKFLAMPCTAQTGILMNKYYISGSLSLGQGDRSYADTSAWLQLGKDSTKKGLLLPRVILDSIITTKRALYVYDLKDSVLYHFDGNKRVRYMTYRDTGFIRLLVQQYVPYTAGYGIKLDTFVFKSDTSVMASRPFVNSENTKNLKYTDTASVVATRSFLLSNYYKNGGNAFGGAAVIGTTDNNPVDIYTNNTRAHRVFANGNHLFGSGTTDAGYKADFQGNVRSTGMFYASSASNAAGFGVEWGGRIGFRNGGQGWRTIIESNGENFTLQDVLHPVSPISGASGLKIDFLINGANNLSNIYSLGVLSKITVGFGRTDGSPSSDGTITSGEHGIGASNMPSTNLTLQAGRGTGNNTSNGNIFMQTPDTSTAGNGAQTYSIKMQVLKNGAVVIGSSGANATAIFHVQSTQKGVILCKMTTSNRDSILSPAEGLEIYNTTIHKKQVFDGTVWQDCW